MSDRPALATELFVRTQGDEIIVEPGPIHGSVGFTLILSKERAKSLAYELIGAATRLLPPTTKAGTE